MFDLWRGLQLLSGQDCPDFQYLQEFAKSNGYPLDDMFALSGRNDPFRCWQSNLDVPATWFMDEIWNRFQLAPSVSWANKVS